MKDSKPLMRNGKIVTYPSQKAYNDDYYDRILQGLQTPPKEETPAPGSTGAVPQSGEMVFRIQIDNAPAAMSSLQTALQDTAKNWGASRSNPYNQGNRRG